MERYARLKLAGVLLERAVERYRLTHQGPVLRRAGELFALLTDGAYEGLRVGKDEEVIVAGEADHLPEQAFYMVGTIDEAFEKAKKIQ